MTPYFGTFPKILEKCQIAAADPGRPPPFSRMLDLRIGYSEWGFAKCVRCAESTYIDIVGYRDSRSQWVELGVVGNLPASPPKVKSTFEGLAAKSKVRKCQKEREISSAKKQRFEATVKRNQPVLR